MLKAGCLSIALMESHVKEAERLVLECTVTIKQYNSLAASMSTRELRRWRFSLHLRLVFCS